MKDDTEIKHRRKPRLALMGEFSAGKSTLSNLLLGADPLPVKVTATRLPPVWISYGEQAAEREDLDGNTEPVDVARLDAVDLEETRLIRLQLKSDILKICDLIDMPGICDPNMQSEVWQAVIGEADHVVWCTHATQAWRQSEAATWESLPQDLRRKSLLLLTRFDKLISTRDRDRVMTRVKRETRGLFHKVFPVSLTQALAAGEDSLTWDKSGAEPFVKSLVDLLLRQGTAEEENRRKSDHMAEQAPPVAEPSGESAGSVRIMPSRVRAKPGGQRRPRSTPPATVGRTGQAQLVEMPGNG